MTEPTATQVENPPLVSVLTAVRNGALVLDRCVQSVLELHRVDVEHIIIDGGSEDDTALVGQALADRYPGRVRFARMPDRSMTEGLIHAVELSRGRYLAPLNADDRYLSGMGQLIDVVAADASRVAFGNCRILRDDGSLKFVTRPWLADHLSVWHLLGCFTPECGYLISRSSYEDVGGYRPAFRFSQDYDLLLRLVGREPVRYIDVDVAEFALTPFSVSSKHRNDMLDELARVNVLGRVGAWLQLLRIDKVGRTLLGLQRYRMPNWSGRSRGEGAS
jgi:glycosyltransferase involved in cell wall biosynthesis